MRPVTEITFVGDEDVPLISTHQPNGMQLRIIKATNFLYNVLPLKQTPAVLTLSREKERGVYLISLKNQNVITKTKSLWHCSLHSSHFLSFRDQSSYCRKGGACPG